jgi:phage shock protein PspC (stress-responsive transcriptional regulator)
MNKVITINLGGAAYQLEEGGYDALRAYLESAAARLQGNPDRDEIVSDIERAIAEKFRALLAGHKTVVETKEVADVLAEMGPIEAEPGEASASGKPGAGASAAGTAGTATGPGAQGSARTDSTTGHDWKARRLYRIHDGSMIAGVCNGLAAYVNIDPTLVRIGFVLLTIFWGTGLLVYIVLAFVVPEARSPEEKAAAAGFPTTAQEFIRRAKEGYYEGMKNFPDRKARREWQRRFKREMRANADQWRQNWQGYWADRVPGHAGIGFALPFLSLLQGAATVLWVCAMVSLMATGTVFGNALPGGVPVWGAAVLMVMAYCVLMGPLKLARRSCYWGMGRPGRSWSVVFLLDALVWVAVVVVLLLFVTRSSTQFRDAIQSVPALAHQAVSDIKSWWQKQ